MNKLTEKLTSASQTGLNDLRTIVNTSLDGIGQLAALNVETARAFAERNAENLAALAQARDLQGLLAVQKPAIIAAAEQSLAYSRRIYQIYSESSTTVTQIVEGQFGGIGRGLVTGLDQRWKAVSPNLQSAVANVKSLFAKAAKIVRPETEAPATANPALPLIEKAA